MAERSFFRLLNLFMLAACGVVHGQTGRGNADAEGVIWTTAMVQSCIQTDDLLRRTCARAGVMLKLEEVKKLCELPAASFEARTARAYAEFRETWRAELKANEVEVAKAVDELRTVFEKHYGHLRAGTFGTMDLVSLNRSARDCTNVEKRWLAPARLKQ